MILSQNQIKVLIVDDSKVSRDLLAYIIELDPKINVIGFAENGLEALNFIETQKPDVIITDIEMPLMNGFQLTKKIMESTPIPIIIVSGVYNQTEIASVFEAINAGALAIIEKPKGIGDSQYMDTARFVAETIKTMSQIKLKTDKIYMPSSTLEITKEKDFILKDKNINIEAVGIGASIGGPKAIRTILSQLSPNFSLPIFLVQHITAGFIEGFINWLNSSTTFTVKLAEDGEKISSNKVYVCPDQEIMTIDSEKHIHLKKVSSLEQSKSSINALFGSMNHVYGKNCVGILLTGVGTDGVDELFNLKKNGAITIVEDEKTAVKFDLPKAAIDKGAVTKTLPLYHIPIYLDNYLKHKLS